MTLTDVADEAEAEAQALPLESMLRARVRRHDLVWTAASGTVVVEVATAEFTFRIERLVERLQIVLAELGPVERAPVEVRANGVVWSVPRGGS